MDAVLVVQIISVTSRLAGPESGGLWGCGFLVRMDDAGLALMNAMLTAQTRRLHGGGVTWAIKGLSVVGTVALLLVSGGIFSHHLPDRLDTGLRWLRI